MRALRLLTPTLCGLLCAGSPAPAQDDAATRTALAAFETEREKVVADALETLTRGDPVEAALAITDAIERVGRHESLVAALERVRGPAAEAAAARITRMLDSDDAGGALAMIARLRAAVHSDELDGLIDRAIVAQRLAESAAFEAAGETGDAMRAAVLASNIAPEDPEVRTAMRRLGLRTVATPAPAAQRPAPGGDGPGGDRIDALEREVRAIREARELERPGGGGSDIALRASLRIDALEQQVRTLSDVVDRYARSLEDIESRQRLDGRAEYATNELDRRVRDLERTINEVRRSVSRVESDLRSLSRRVDRIR